MTEREREEREGERDGASSECRQSVAKVICPPSPRFGSSRWMQRLIDYAAPIAASARSISRCDLKRIPANVPTFAKVCAE